LAKRLESELVNVLSDDDPFWGRWHFLGKRQGWLS
jgi:hypothetical protein